MLTFHPVASFEETARILDYKRLGKQRLEALQILKAMLGIVKHFKTQPAAKAWKNCEAALCVYGSIMCDEWKRRGYVDNTKPVFAEIYYHILRDMPVTMPRWIGYEPFHSNQRAILLNKEFYYYAKFNWAEEPTDTYIFPTHLY